MIISILFFDDVKCCSANKRKYWIDGWLVYKLFNKQHSERFRATLNCLSNYLIFNRIIIVVELMKWLMLASEICLNN